MQPVIINADELGHSSSPYVAMHKSDLVKWRLWNAEVLTQAKKENKLIFITIGYFSCYWCHVLQKESFNNLLVSTTLNENFVSAVVDREVHSALDSHMVEFAEKTLGHSGWPLNIILTPEGYPLMAAIYYPANLFNSWLEKGLSLWKTDPEYIKTIAKDAAQELQLLVKPKAKKVTPEVSRSALKKFIREIKENSDDMNGGFGEQSKFPLPAIISAAIRISAEENDAEMHEFIKLTMEQLRTKGLRDHLEDGFFRYTTDPNWYIPHFEKMLYDNALLAEVFLEAGQKFKNENWTNTAVSVLDHLESSFKNIKGGYFGSLSAVDEKGVEGGYYLWSSEEWGQLLNKEEQIAAKQVWAWSQPPLLEEGYYPLFINPVKSKNEKNSIQSAVHKLAKVRKQRVLPVDKKIIFSWNALVLNALLKAFEVKGDKKYQKRASDLAAFLVKNFTDNKRYKALYNANLVGSAGLEDYAYVSHALLKYDQMFDNKKFRELAKQLLHEAWQRFYDDYGWRLSDKLVIPIINSESIVADGPLPSPSARLIAASLISNDEKLRAKAKKALELGHARLQSQAFWYASHVLLLQNTQIHANE